MEVRVTRISDLGHANLFAAYPIVDVETRQLLKDVDWDSRRLTPTVVGIFFKNLIIQIIRRTSNAMLEMSRKVAYELESVRKPFLAFNCDFDKFVIYGLWTSRSITVKPRKKQNSITTSMSTTLSKGTAVSR